MPSASAAPAFILRCRTSFSLAVVLGLGNRDHPPTTSAARDEVKDASRDFPRDVLDLGRWMPVGWPIDKFRGQLTRRPAHRDRPRRPVGRPPGAGE